ncbi:SCO6880 family protein [Thermomonospora umbrina]|uniref:Type VII secretion protein EccE n=1 Tax=Thermomonospora umbrina TaxID=111806 RepID=A0A3D9T5W5_9ACTN|nr:SCO6880 family protein [Thermomonospora umbrina]REF00636.1 hypothetical protein DFJ69_6192 [Thermomonospora umbrina]
MSAPRTYGGWRQRRGIGVAGLGSGGTLLLLAGIVVVVLTGSLAPRALLYVGPPVLAAGALTFIRVGGVSAGGLILQRARWSYGSRRGWTRYRAGVVVELPRAFQLPGVLATTTLLTAEDGFGGHYGLVWDRRSGLLTATLRVVPTSTWLADRTDADGWVANWGAWLASLGHMPTVKWVTVTVDTAPDPGDTLTDSVTAAMSPTAPTAARDIMRQLVQAAPSASADVDTRVSMTFDARAAPTAPKDLLSAVAEVGRTLQGLESTLATSGVTVVGRATCDDIAGVVRTAFDPAARGEVNRILAAQRAGLSTEGLGYSDAGPVGAEEHPGHYQHDGGISVTWAWHEAPRANVHADVLARLLSPGPYPKRVSLQYRPFPAAEATRVLETEVNAATFRRHYRLRTGRDETARDATDQARAQQAAREEAMGAGVLLMALYVTATVTNDTHLPHAIADTEACAEASKIRLRRMWNSQQAGFATTLPCGICPPVLARHWPN